MKKSIYLILAVNGFRMVVEPAGICRCDENFQTEKYVFGDLASVLGQINKEFSPEAPVLVVPALPYQQAPFALQIEQVNNGFILTKEQRDNSEDLFQEEEFVFADAQAVCKHVVKLISAAMTEKPASEAA